MKKSIQGNCCCQRVCFEVQPPILFCVHCHCNFCRKAQGSAFATWVGFKEEHFRYKTGGDLIRWYGTTPQSRRGFCSQCGSTMFYRSTMIPGEIHIARPYLETTFETVPAAHVFFDQRVDWCAIHDELDKIDSNHEALSKYKKIGK